MTLTTDHNWIAYTASAAQTVFPYDFLVVDEDDLLVYLDTVLQPAANYSVSGVGLGSGGNVTLAVATTGGEVVLLIRATDTTQQIDLLEGARLPAAQVEGLFDKVYAAVQDIRETATRAFGLPVSRAGDAPTMPDLDDTAVWGKALKVNATGDGLEVFSVLSSDIASPIVAEGDLIRGSAADTPERLPIGTSGKVLTSDGSQASWQSPVTGIAASLFDAKGDLVVATAADTAARKAAGVQGSVLVTDQSTSDGLAWIVAAAAHGRCRLRRSSATLLSLDPHNGHTILLKDGNGWRLRTLIGSVTGANTNVYVDGVAGQDLAADTTYLVTLTDDGSLVFDFLTSLAHAADADTGVEIATGNATHTVIGMIRTNASSQFEDSVTKRFVRSWFHRAPVGCRASLTADRTTVSTTYAKLHAEVDLQYLIWAGEVVLGTVSGRMSNNTAGTIDYCGIGFDTTTAPESGVSIANIASTTAYPIGCTALRTDLAEGVHTQSVCVRVSANTGTWEGSTAPEQLCHTATIIVSG